MNKAQTWEAVQAILEQHKHDKRLAAELELLLAPKSGGGVTFPPKLDDDGNIIELYCAWHKQYEPVEDFKFIKSKDKYHYECLVAEKEWTKYAKAINKIKDDIKNLINDVIDGNITPEEAKEIKETKESEIKSLETKRKNKEDYIEA